MTPRENIRCLVKTREDIQKLRIRASNRLKCNRDMEKQGMTRQSDTIMTTDQFATEMEMALDFTVNEKAIDRRIQSYLKGIPVYENFLKGVKGCGPQMAAVIISEFDIEKATTVSKMWQYSGMNPGLVRGRKADSDGSIRLTDDMVRGDRPTKGYVLPYNKFLKTKMLGVFAGNFIKTGSPYRKFYDDYKLRMSNSEKEFKEGRKWKDEPKAHIDMAARRYMMKMFLRDLYREWRTMEGLEVRVPYEEEYLGRTHHE